MSLGRIRKVLLIEGKGGRGSRRASWGKDFAGRWLPIFFVLI